MTSSPVVVVVVVAVRHPMEPKVGVVCLDIDMAMADIGGNGGKDGVQAVLTLESGDENLRKQVESELLCHVMS